MHVVLVDCYWLPLMTRRALGRPFSVLPWRSNNIPWNQSRIALSLNPSSGL
jgi:hypothetical protein